MDRGSFVADIALKAIGMAEGNLLSYLLYQDGDGVSEGDGEVDGEVDDVFIAL